MGVIVHAAKPEIDKMGRYDGRYGGEEQQQMGLVPELFAQQQQHAERKQAEGKGPMVVFFIAVVKGARADGKGEQYHKIFKSRVIDDIHAQYGQAAQQQRENSSMDGAGHRSSDSNSVPV